MNVLLFLALLVGGRLRYAKLESIAARPVHRLSGARRQQEFQVIACWCLSRGTPPTISRRSTRQPHDLILRGDSIFPNDLRGRV